MFDFRKNDGKIASYSIASKSIHPIKKSNKYINEVLVQSDNGPPQVAEEKRHILPKNVKGDDTKVIKIKSKDYKNHNYLLGRLSILLI